MLYLKDQVISGFLPNTFLIFDTQELKLMNFRSTISRLPLNQWFPTWFYLLISFQEKKKKRQTPSHPLKSTFKQTEITPQDREASLEGSGSL